MYTVKKLLIYPIKGLPGIEVEEAFAETKGFRLDRRWMITDKHGTFISQRTHPILTQIKQRTLNGHLIIEHENENILFPVESSTAEKQEVTVWEDTFMANKVPGEISEFLSEVLREEVMLVKMKDDNTRVKKLHIGNLESTPVSFADGYPYLLLGSASMDFLNSKLKEELTIDRFRPNLYIDTKTPHQEDNWDTLSGKETTFQIIKPCVRCSVTTIDQQTGKKGKEPLKTLATYRKVDNGVIFGANAIVLHRGMIRVGEQLEVNNE